MPNHHWQLLEDIQKNLVQPGDLPRGLLSALAVRLDDALCGPTRAPLDTLATQLKSLFGKLMRLAPDETVRAVRQAPDSGKDGLAAAGVAYLMGQLGFAQMLAAQAAARRVDDGFQATMRDTRHRPYVDALAKQECSTEKLAEMTGRPVDTVRGELKLLREQGVTDFRRDGGSFQHFLTSAALAMVAESERSAVAVVHREASQASVQDQGATRLVGFKIRENIQSKIPPHFRHHESFSPMPRLAA